MVKSAADCTHSDDPHWCAGWDRGRPVREHGSDQSTGSLMPHIAQRGWLRGKRWDEMREGKAKGGQWRRVSGSVLQQALLCHPVKRGKRLFTSGVPELQQVAHFPQGPQRLAEEQDNIRNLNPKWDYLYRSKQCDNKQTIKKRATLKIPQAELKRAFFSWQRW